MDVDAWSKLEPFDDQVQRGARDSRDAQAPEWVEWAGVKSRAVVAALFIDWSSILVTGESFATVTDGLIVSQKSVGSIQSTSYAVNHFISQPRPFWYLFPRLRKATVAHPVRITAFD